MNLSQQPLLRRRSTAVPREARRATGECLDRWECGWEEEEDGGSGIVRDAGLVKVCVVGGLVWHGLA